MIQSDEGSLAARFATNIETSMTLEEEGTVAPLPRSG